MIQLWHATGKFYAVTVEEHDRLQVKTATAIDSSDVPSLLQEGLSHHCLSDIRNSDLAEAGEVLMQLDAEGLVEEKFDLN